MVDILSLDALVAEARRLQERTLRRQLRAERASVAFQHAIRRLHASGASIREIAAALGISHQRVHQILDVTGGKGALKRARAQVICNLCTEHIEPECAVAGPGVYVCAGCVERGRRLLVSPASATAQDESMRPLALDGGKGTCGFCGRSASALQPLARAPRGLAPPLERRRRRRPGASICRDCLDLAGQILEAQAKRPDSIA